MGAWVLTAGPLFLGVPSIEVPKYLVNRIDITEVAPTDGCGDGGKLKNHERFDANIQGNRQEVVTITMAGIPKDPASFHLCVMSSSSFTTAEGGQAVLNQTDHGYWGHLPDCPTPAAGQVMCAHKELNMGRLEIRYQPGATGTSARTSSWRSLMDDPNPGATSAEY